MPHMIGYVWNIFFHMNIAMRDFRQYVQYAQNITYTEFVSRHCVSL